jgi:hypothetical protein
MDKRSAGIDPALTLGTIAVLIKELLADPHRYSSAREVRLHENDLRALLAALAGWENEFGAAACSDTGDAREAVMAGVEPALDRAQELRRFFETSVVSGDRSV